MAWHGMAWHGMSGQGRAGQGRACMHGMPWRDKIKHIRHTGTAFLYFIKQL